MDKYFLLTYTQNGYDGARHSRYAWFETEQEMRAFAESRPDLETELAIEILSSREVSI